METSFHQNDKKHTSGSKFSLVAKFVIPIVFIGTFLLAGTTYSVKPSRSEKQSSGKTPVTTNKSDVSKLPADYLRYIMPKAIYNAGNMETYSYVKDANGVYHLVVNEGC